MGIVGVLISNPYPTDMLEVLWVYVAVYGQNAILLDSIAQIGFPWCALCCLIFLSLVY